MTTGAYISALPSFIKRDIEEWTFSVYITDALQIIAENTAIQASAITDGKMGKLLSRRWCEKSDSAQENSHGAHTADEVIDRVKKALEEVNKSELI